MHSFKLAKFICFLFEHSNNSVKTKKINTLLSFWIYSITTHSSKSNLFLTHNILTTLVINKNFLSLNLFFSYIKRSNTSNVYFLFFYHFLKQNFFFNLIELCFYITFKRKILLNIKIKSSFKQNIFSNNSSVLTHNVILI